MSSLTNTISTNLNFSDVVASELGGQYYQIFHLTNIENFKSINLKCDPDLALELRANYNAVEPGYHMNKKYWNTVYVNQDVKDNDIKNWIKDSYNLVILNIPKSKRSRKI